MRPLTIYWQRGLGGACNDSSLDLTKGGEACSCDFSVLYSENSLDRNFNTRQFSLSTFRVRSGIAGSTSA